MAKTEVSVIMLSYNGLNYTVQAVESVLRQDADFELICVDNASSDGTEGYLKSVAYKDRRVKLMLNPDNRGVPGGLNDGMGRAEGKYIVWLNNDIILSRNSLALMKESLDYGGNALGLTKVGMVGTMMNFVAGRQAVSDAEYFASDLDSFALEFRQEYQDNLYHTGWLCGSCLMMTRELVEEVGELDERFFPGGYEDNDYCLRAQLKGYKLLIAGDIFVHHWGSATFKRSEFEPQQWGTRHRDTYYAKWRDDKKRKLVAVYRVKDCAYDLRRSLQQTEKFADEIVVWCDNCSDDTPQVAAECDKVVRIVQSDLPFDERRDRNAVISLAKEYNPDWIMVVDCDEVLEDKFDYDYAQRLMNPVNPEVMAYGFHFYNFWHSQTQWRTDGIFGEMKGFRMFRNLPEQMIVGGTSIGLHCGSIPPVPIENCRWTGVRIKHYAFDDKEKARTKYEWYQEIDKEKDEEMIGGADYSHLVSSEFALSEWKEKNDISFYCLAHNSEQDLSVLLDVVSTVVDEIVVVNHQSDDLTAEVARSYGAKVVDWKDEVDFSAMRNLAKAKCTGNWILTMDTDERMDDEFVVVLRKLVEPDVDGYLFDVNNYHKGGGFSHSETVRLFRNISQFEYRGLVHENFDQAVKDNNLTIVKLPFLIHHYGYLKESGDVKDKLKLYLELNQKQLDLNPDDAKAHFNLALHYLNEGEIEKGRGLLEKAAELDEKYYHPRLQLAAQALREAQQWLNEVVPLMNPQHRIMAQTQVILSFLDEAIGEQALMVE